MVLRSHIPGSAVDRPAVVAPVNARAAGQASGRVPRPMIEAANVLIRRSVRPNWDASGFLGSLRAAACVWR